MSNIDFFNPQDVPQARDKIKVERLEAKPYPDGWRVRVIVEVTPFQERPSLELRVRTQAGKLVSELSIIETMVRHMEFTVHIRSVQTSIGEYTAEAALYYGEDPTKIQHLLTFPFTIEAT